jgi:hypothetical protein
MMEYGVNRWLLLLVFGVWANGWTPVRGDEELSPEEKSAGFQSLFNGKDLSGFTEVQGRPGAFWVEEGVLCGTREGLKAYWLSTEKKYADFELRLDYMLTPGGNSGIFIRVPHHRPRTSVVGMEIQLLDDGGKEGVPTSKDTGAIYRVAAAKKFAARPANEWNSLIVRCEGDRIQVTLNGELINDFDMASDEQTKNRPREGFIGLSAHTDVVKFRRIRIKEIGDAGGGRS